MRYADRIKYARPEGPWLDVDERGRRVVLAADERIVLDIDGANRLLAAEGCTDLIEPHPDGTVALDSAGEVRYRFLEVDRWQRDVRIYQRVA